VPRDCGVRSVDRVGFPDRIEPAGILPGAGAAVAKIVERVHPGYYAERHLVNPLDAAVPSAALR